MAQYTLNGEHFYYGGQEDILLELLKLKSSNLENDLLESLKNNFENQTVLVRARTTGARRRSGRRVNKGDDGGGGAMTEIVQRDVVEAVTNEAGTKVAQSMSHICASRETPEEQFIPPQDLPLSGPPFELKRNNNVALYKRIWRLFKRNFGNSNVNDELSPSEKEVISAGAGINEDVGKKVCDNTDEMSKIENPSQVTKVLRKLNGALARLDSSVVGGLKGTSEKLTYWGSYFSLPGSTTIRYDDKGRLPDANNFRPYTRATDKNRVAYITWPKTEEELEIDPVGTLKWILFNNNLEEQVPPNNRITTAKTFEEHSLINKGLISFGSLFRRTSSFVYNNRISRLLGITKLGETLYYAGTGFFSIMKKTLPTVARFLIKWGPLIKTAVDIGLTLQAGGVSLLASPTFWLSNISVFATQYILGTGFLNRFFNFNGTYMATDYVKILLLYSSVYIIKNAASKYLDTNAPVLKRYITHAYRLYGLVTLSRTIYKSLRMPSPIQISNVEYTGSNNAEYIRSVLNRTENEDYKNLYDQYQEATDLANSATVCALRPNLGPENWEVCHSNIDDAVSGLDNVLESVENLKSSDFFNDETQKFTNALESLIEERRSSLIEGRGLVNVISDQYDLKVTSESLNNLLENSTRYNEVQNELNTAKLECLDTNSMCDLDNIRKLESELDMIQNNLDGFRNNKNILISGRADRILAQLEKSKIVTESFKNFAKSGVLLDEMEKYQALDIKIKNALENCTDDICEIGPDLKEQLADLKDAIEEYANRGDEIQKLRANSLLNLININEESRTDKINIETLSNQLYELDDSLMILDTIHNEVSAFASRVDSELGEIKKIIEDHLATYDKSQPSILFAGNIKSSFEDLLKDIDEYNINTENFPETEAMINDIKDSLKTSVETVKIILQERDRLLDTATAGGIYTEAAVVHAIDEATKGLYDQKSVDKIVSEAVERGREGLLEPEYVDNLKSSVEDLFALQRDIILKGGYIRDREAFESIQKISFSDVFSQNNTLPYEHFKDILEDLSKEGEDVRKRFFETFSVDQLDSTQTILTFANQSPVFFGQESRSSIAIPTEEFEKIKWHSICENNECPETVEKSPYKTMGTILTALGLGATARPVAGQVRYLARVGAGIITLGATVISMW